ncbi:hypothetical protein HSX10_18335 [Winogradskyella undariae]|uniref:hypothetical protein n=1 Tax=Winogradskyella undariae TaxID=1285465 RepID=UPI00156A8D1A|nr:hypothetical protein [Winogradskyella undariae]NRR93535.1 hypothetical protein [Winogradskyella undariae]
MANCIFCNNKKISKEHLWGAWWQDYYPASEKDLLTRDGHTITARNSNNDIISEKGLFSNVGDPLAKTTKVVCQNCNNTWMSAIEEDMKKTFHKLFINEEDIISSDDILRLKKWMYLKFCLIDRAYSKQNSLVSSSLSNSKEIKEQINLIRKENWKGFLNGINLPNEFRFFIARATGELKIGSFNYIPLIMLEKDNLLNIKLIDTCMFFNGHFLGILTSNDIVIKFLNNNEKFKGLLPLVNDTIKFITNKKVSARELEDSILCELEKNIIGRKLRRNFSKSI